MAVLRSGFYSTDRNPGLLGCMLFFFTDRIVTLKLISNPKINDLLFSSQRILNPYLTIVSRSLTVVILILAFHNESVLRTNSAINTAIAHICHWCLTPLRFYPKRSSLDMKSYSR